MKRAYLFLATLLVMASAFPQTDVTDIYLKNAGFDDQDAWQSTNMASTDSPNSAEVTGWTLTKSAAWSSSAAFGYSSQGMANGVQVPDAGPDGSANGGALGISTGWGGKICYEQQVVLPAGKYRISYAAYNNLSEATQSFNYIGFVTDTGEEYFSVINNFLYQTWMEDEVILHLSEPTKGSICVGLGAVSGGSGSNAKVFIDHIKIEAYNAAETMMPGTSLSLQDWTGNTGLYDNGTYQEYYQGYHYTGPVMQSVYNVENGTYSADVTFHSHMAWIDKVAGDGSLNAYVKANNITRATEVVNNTGLAAYEPKTYHLEDIQVTDGNLSLEVGNSAEGGNWLTVKTKKLTQMTTPKVSYGAFALPETPVTPDYWYLVDVPITGPYQLSADGETVISYTQDPDALVTDDMLTTQGGKMDLAEGSLYLKASAATIVSLKSGLADSLRFLVGDINSDGTLSVSDVMLMVSMIMANNITCETQRADMNEDGKVNVTDVLFLVSVIMGKWESRYIDLTYTYADIEALVAAEQSAEENAEGAGYILGRAVSLLTGLDVGTQYDMSEWVTTLNIAVPFDNVESVSVYSADHTAIAGPMTILRKGDDTSFSFTTGNASTYTASSQSDVVTVRGNGLSSYTAYLLPQTLSNGVLVTLHTADGKYYSQHFDQIDTKKVNDWQFTVTQASNLWMSTLPGNVFFSMLSTPGAHDACTSSVSVSSAKCQGEDLAALLANGVRAFDLRPRYNASSESDIKLDNLTIYHGMVSTGVKFKDAIDILIDFVKDNPSEAVSVIMQKEDSHAIFSLTDYSETWRASIRECFSDAERSPYIMPDLRNYHTLDDVRGKVSIVSKNPYGNSSNGYRDVIYGAVIENWPDDGIVSDFSCNMTQAWNWVDCYASVEDAYNSSTDTKETQVAASLSLASSNTNRYHYVYTFLSIANSPASYAATINPKTVEIIGSLSGPLGYVYADYQGSASNGGQQILRAIVEQNNKYVYQGQSRINP